ncbi:MAG: DUF2203 domain-containing protein [Nanoarchaeota archaeon]
MKKKYFTLNEAEELLPEITIKLNRLIRLSKAINILNKIEINYEDEFEFITNEINSRKNSHKLYYQFYMLLEEILNYGVIVKDLNFGLVDFYSKYNDQEIFLCWQLGENKIKYWHEAESGYDERKPIELLKELNF